MTSASRSSKPLTRVRSRLTRPLEYIDEHTTETVRKIMQLDPFKLTLAGRHEKRAAKLPELEAPEEPTAKPAPRAKRRGFVLPKRRHVFWLAVVAVAVLRPLWVLGPVILSVLLVTGTFLLLGPDRFWAGVQGRLRRYEAVAPKRAARLVARLDRLAERWDGVLDRLPESWAERFALPSFAASTQSVVSHENRLDERFAALKQQG